MRWKTSNENYNFNSKDKRSTQWIVDLWVFLIFIYEFNVSFMSFFIKRMTIRCLTWTFQFNDCHNCVIIACCVNTCRTIWKVRWKALNECYNFNSKCRKSTQWIVDLLVFLIFIYEFIVSFMSLFVERMTIRCLIWFCEYDVRHDYVVITCCVNTCKTIWKVRWKTSNENYNFSSKDKKSTQWIVDLWAFMISFRNFLDFIYEFIVSFASFLIERMTIRLSEQIRMSNFHDFVCRQIFAIEYLNARLSHKVRCCIIEFLLLSASNSMSECTNIMRLSLRWWLNEDLSEICMQYHFFSIKCSRIFAIE